MYDYTKDKEKQELARNANKEHLLTLNQYRRLERIWLKKTKLGYWFLITQLEKQARVITYAVKDCRSGTPVECWQLRDCLCTDYNNHISITNRDHKRI